MRIIDYINKNVNDYFEQRLEVKKDAETMNNSRGGDFTRNLLSLQLQFQTLLEGVGGESTASLLDGLAQLSESEREKIIPLLSHVILRITSGDKHVRAHRNVTEIHFHLRHFIGRIVAAVARVRHNPPVRSKHYGAKPAPPSRFAHALLIMVRWRNLDAHTVKCNPRRRRVSKHG